MIVPVPFAMTRAESPSSVAECLLLLCGETSAGQPSPASRLLCTPRGWCEWKCHLSTLLLANSPEWLLFACAKSWMRSTRPILQVMSAGTEPVLKSFPPPPLATRRVCSPAALSGDPHSAFSLLHPASPPLSPLTPELARADLQQRRGRHSEQGTTSKVPHIFFTGIPPELRRSWRALPKGYKYSENWTIML